MPSSSIKATNTVVHEALEKCLPRGPYISLTSAQKYSFGKTSAENRTTATLRYYAKTFPDLPLKETTVRFKNNYQSSLKTASDGSSDASEPLTIASTANKYIFFSGSRGV